QAADAFALWPHRAQTLWRRGQVLFLAPFWGLAPLTRLDTQAPPRGTRLGRGEHSAPRSQWLGHLERVGAAAALLPPLWPAHAGQGPSVDGPMSASGARGAMHQGTIPRRGRSMAGAPAVLAHNAAGHALCVADQPPARTLTNSVVPQEAS